MSFRNTHSLFLNIATGGIGGVHRGGEVSMFLPCRVSCLRVSVQLKKLC